MTDIYPTDINFSSESKCLTMSWGNNHNGVISYQFLRGACPCTHCKGSHTPSVIDEIIPVLGVELLDILPLGNYAIRILWDDGHHTGIYTYDYLKRLCMCVDCTNPKQSS